MGSLGEFASSTGTVSVTSSVKRTGSYSLRSNPTAGSGWAAISSRIAGGGLTDFFGGYPGGVCLRIDSLPSVNTRIVEFRSGDGATVGYYLQLNTDGTLTVRENAGASPVSSTLAFTADQRFHVIQLNRSGTSVTVDGVPWITISAAGGGADQIRIGSNIDGAGNVTCDLYFDDFWLQINQSDTDDNPPNIVMLLPAADPGALNSWTNGGGGTTSIFEGVNNRPPTGAAASTNGSKIKNAANGGNLNYTATMQTYLAAGVPVGSKINVVVPICNDGEEVGTATKAGNLWIASNPTVGAGANTFDYGDDVGALGTFPTGWATHWGFPSSNPSVTLSTAPTMTVRKTTSTTRVVDVDFMGIYVDYTPPAILNVISNPQPSHFTQLTQF